MKFKKYMVDKFTFIPRRSNIDTLARLGITVKHARQIIVQLTYKDYYRGPARDRGGPEFNVWEFGKEINGDQLYIKLSDDFAYDYAKCISFHIAEYEIKYPYKK